MKNTLVKFAAKAAFGATIGMIVAPARVIASGLGITGRGLVRSGEACLRGQENTVAFADRQEAGAKERIVNRITRAELEKAAKGLPPEYAQALREAGAKAGVFSDDLTAMAQAMFTKVIDAPVVTEDPLLAPARTLAKADAIISNLSGKMDAAGEDPLIVPA